MRILLALAVLLLSGCSPMPDRYRDRAMDYQNHRATSDAKPA